MANDKQRTAQWFAEREGKLTASVFGQAAGIAPGSRQQLWRRLAGLEIFEGNAATQWGEDKEPIALQAYTDHTKTNVELVGFVAHPHYDWLGGSPDFIVPTDRGMGEIKCPASQKLYESIPPYYMAQMQGLMQIADKDWCDFVVWTPEIMSVQRVLRCNQYWDWLHVRLADFWTWVQAGVEPPRERKEIPFTVPQEFLTAAKLIAL